MKSDHVRMSGFAELRANGKLRRRTQRMHLHRGPDPEGYYEPGSTAKLLQ